MHCERKDYGTDTAAADIYRVFNDGAHFAAKIQGMDPSLVAHLRVSHFGIP